MRRKKCIAGRSLNARSVSQDRVPVLPDINVQFVGERKCQIRNWSSASAQSVKAIMNIARIIYLHISIFIEVNTSLEVNTSFEVALVIYKGWCYNINAYVPL